MAKKHSNNFLKFFLIVAYCIALAFELHFVTSQGVSGDDALMITLSVFFFIIPLISLFIPRQIHNLLYKLGGVLMKKSDVTPEYKWDSYKKYEKICIGLLILADVFIILAVVVKFLMLI